MSGLGRRFAAALAAAHLCASAAWAGAGPASWTEDLTPIGLEDWDYARAAHLLERAGFGGTPEEIRALARMTPEQAVRHLVDHGSVDNSHLQPFDESGAWDPGLDPFPVSRPATTEQAGRAFGRAAAASAGCVRQADGASAASHVREGSDPSRVSMTVLL